jgi:hypothetical protein
VAKSVVKIVEDAVEIGKKSRVPVPDDHRARF